MRIAVVAHSAFAVPHKWGDGAGLVALNSAEELVRRGHQVTLFAPNRSKVSECELVEVCEQDGGNRSGERKMALAVEKRAKDFDVIYDHTHAHLLSRWYPELPIVNHCHDRETGQVGVRNSVACSRNQQEDIGAKWVVWNGVDTDFYTFGEDKRENYALWLGRNTPDKNLPAAQWAAAKAGIELKAFGPGLPAGPVDALQKLAHMQRASVLLFTALKECGPLTVIEAQACGLPVVCLDAGGTPEYVSDDYTGIVCKSRWELPDAIAVAAGLNRDTCIDYADEYHSLAAFGDRIEPILEGVANGN